MSGSEITLSCSVTSVERSASKRARVLLMRGRGLSLRSNDFKHFNPSSGMICSIEKSPVDRSERCSRFGRYFTRELRLASSIQFSLRFKEMREGK